LTRFCLDTRLGQQGRKLGALDLHKLARWVKLSNRLEGENKIIKPLSITLLEWNESGDEHLVVCGHHHRVRLATAHSGDFKLLERFVANRLISILHVAETELPFLIVTPNVKLSVFSGASGVRGASADSADGYLLRKFDLLRRVDREVGVCVEPELATLI